MSLVFNGEGEMKKIAAISLISIYYVWLCCAYDETSIGKFGAYKSNIQRKLDNQTHEAEASLAKRISGAENTVKNDATHFCVTQGKKMQIVELKTEGVGLHGVARLTFKCGE